MCPMACLAWILLNRRSSRNFPGEMVNENGGEENDESAGRIACGRCHGCGYCVAGARQSACHREYRTGYINKRRRPGLWSRAAASDGAKHRESFVAGGGVQ